MRYSIYKIALSGDIHQQNFSFRSLWIFKSKIKILQKFICNKKKYFKAFKHSMLGVKPKNICVYSIHNVYYAFSYMATSIINCSIESITVLIEKEDQHIIPYLITLLQQKNKYISCNMHLLCMPSHRRETLLTFQYTFIS